MRKSLKKQFANNSFDGLDKTKINIYISGNVSEYCTKSGITKCRYLRKKKEIISEFCIDRYYWTSEPLLDVKRKFLLFIEDLIRRATADRAADPTNRKTTARRTAAHRTTPTNPATRCTTPTSPEAVFAFLFPSLGWLGTAIRFFNRTFV